MHFNQMIIGLLFCLIGFGGFFISIKNGQTFGRGFDWNLWGRTIDRDKEPATFWMNAFQYFVVGCLGIFFMFHHFAQ